MPEHESQPFAFVRAQNINDFGDLGRLENHGRGIGKTAEERRVIHDEGAPRAIYYRCDCEHMVIGKHGTKYKQAKLREALKSHLEKHDAKIRGNTMLSMNLIVGVSSRWLDVGAPEDDPNYRRDYENNKLIGALLKYAIAWANREFGPKDAPAVYAARLDLDEMGTGNVDLFIAPLRPEKRSGNLFVSVRKSMAEFAGRYGWHRSRSFIPLQDSWTRYASDRLKAHFRRGDPVAETGRQHLSPETMRAIGDKANPESRRLRNETKDLRAEVKGLRTGLDAFERNYEDIAKALDRDDIDEVKAVVARKPPPPPPPPTHLRKRRKRGRGGGDPERQL